MKAQTALEYLMTYGWAILIVVIVIGALYGLGLTKPCKWTGTQVREFPDFTVANPKYTGAGGLGIDVSRLKPDSVSVTGLSGKQSTATSYVTATSPTLPYIMSSSIAPVRASFTGLGALTAGDCYTADVVINYTVTTAGGAVAYTSSGKVSGVVEAA